MDNEWRDESVFCVIEGKPELRQKLGEIGADTGAIYLLYEPILWEQVRQVRRDILPNFKEDRSYIGIQIKLTFLASLWHDYVSGNEEHEICAIIKNLLGSPPISYTTFDRWWTIKPFEQHLKSSECEEQLSASELEIFDKTSNPIADQWLTTLIEQKKSTPSV